MRTLLHIRRSDNRFHLHPSYSDFALLATILAVFVLLLVVVQSVE